MKTFLNNLFKTHIRFWIEMIKVFYGSKLERSMRILHDFNRKQTRLAASAAIGRDVGYSRISRRRCRIIKLFLIALNLWMDLKGKLNQSQENLAEFHSSTLNRILSECEEALFKPQAEQHEIK